MADPTLVFAARRRTLHTRLLDALTALFLGLGSWREPDAGRFVATAVPLLRGAQTALIALVDAYLAALLSRDLNTPVRPAGVDPGPVIAAVRGDVASETVYRRPFDELWTALHDSRSLSEAVQLGATRAQEVAEVDLQITHSHAAQAALNGSPAADRVTGWRRVLTGDTSCALCAIASTQRYTVAELNPMHPGCDCTVAPITGADRHVARK